MTRMNISKYIFLTISLLFPLSLWAQKPVVDTSGASQTKQEVRKAVAASREGEEKKPFLQGIGISTDLVGVGNKLFGGTYISSEVAAEVNLLNRYMPIVEVGFGSSDMVDEDKEIAYKTSAPYFRVGMNYNFMHKKDTYSIIYGGLRYGFSSFSFDISAPDLQDPVWGGSVPFHYEGLSCTAQWLELVAGIRAQVWKNLHMGWSVRYKRLLSSTEHPNAEPHYIPGYGVKDDVLFGFSYNIIYYLPLNKKR